MVAAQLAVFVGFLQGRLDVLVVAVGPSDGQRGVERDTSTFNRNQQSLLAVLEQLQDAIDVVLAQPGFQSDSLFVIALVPQLLNARQQLQGSPLAAGDVFSQAHDETVFVADIDDHGRDGGLAQGLEGLEPTFTADQQEFLPAIAVLARRDRDRLLQANVLDVADDVIEDSAVAVARIEDFYLVDRNHLEIAGWMFFAHAALLTRVRSAMPCR